MTTKKDAVLTLKWKPDWVLGCDSSAGLEVGSVSSRLRLQDLQIKGKAGKGKKHVCRSPVLVDVQPGTRHHFINGKDYA